jgi:hypothetical protein
VKPTAKRTVRIIFGLTVLWIALLQYTLFAFGGEPYPALVLPGFPAECSGCLLETGVPTAKEPMLLVRFADGHTQQVPLETVLPPGPSVRLLAFTTAFEDPNLKSKPAVVSWLRSKIAQRFPNAPATGLDVVWRKATYDAANAAAVQYAPLYTIHVDFENPK